MKNKISNGYIDMMGHVVMPGDRCAVMHNFYRLSGTVSRMQDMIYVGKRRGYHTFVETKFYQKHGEEFVRYKYDTWAVVRSHEPERFGVCVEEEYIRVTEPVKTKAGK